METYTFLMNIALILLVTKLFGLFSRRLQMPAVVGSLIAGILLGPCLLNIVSLEGNSGIILKSMSELGVILLMFSAGLETDLKELKKNSVAALIVAGIGVIVPIIGGFLCYQFVFHSGFGSMQELMKAIFVGVVLSATSVSITVETLRELGKLNGKVGTTILGAAVIDDILGIIILTIVSSLQDSSVKVGSVFLKIAIYFAFIVLTYILVHFMKEALEKYNLHRRITILSLAFCLILAYVSEAVFGIADITGAYFAGLILCNLQLHKYVGRRVEIASYMFFSPIFFASIGLEISLKGLTPEIILFAVLLTLVAILSKVIGCGLGAKFCKFSKKEALQIGVGMISRGEVALIVTQKGVQYGIVSEKLFAPVVLMVIITTLITPVLLKIVMKDHIAFRFPRLNSHKILRTN